MPKAIVNGINVLMKIILYLDEVQLQYSFERFF